MSKKQTQVAAGRQPVDLSPTGAVMSVINHVLAQDAVKIALGSFIEGKALPGEWGLQIQSARLVPLDKSGRAVDSA